MGAYKSSLSLAEGLVEDIFNQDLDEKLTTFRTQTVSQHSVSALNIGNFSGSCSSASETNMEQNPAWATLEYPTKILHLSLFMGVISRYSGAWGVMERYRSLLLYVTLFIKVGFEWIETIMPYLCVYLIEAETGKEEKIAAGLKVQLPQAEVIVCIYNKSPLNLNVLVPFPTCLKHNLCI